MSVRDLPVIRRVVNTLEAAEIAIRVGGDEVSFKLCDLHDPDGQRRLSEDRFIRTLGDILSGIYENAGGADVRERAQRLAVSKQASDAKLPAAAAAEVIDLHDAKRAEVDSVLDQTFDYDLVEVVVLGITAEGKLYQHATRGDPHRFVYMLEDYKWCVLRTANERQERV